MRLCAEHMGRIKFASEAFNCLRAGYRQHGSVSIRYGKQGAEEEVAAPG